MTSSDDSQILENLAVEIRLNHPQTFSIFTTGNAHSATSCGGCGSSIVSEHHDDLGREIRQFACGHRYIIGAHTVLIERV